MQEEPTIEENSTESKGSIEKSFPIEPIVSAPIEEPSPIKEEPVVSGTDTPHSPKETDLKFKIPMLTTLQNLETN